MHKERGTQDLSRSPEVLDAKLSRAKELLERRTKELEVLMKASRTLLGQRGFIEEARGIFDCCRELTGASSGYVALLSDDGEENELLFLEAGGLPCDVDPELPMPIRGLREEAYRDGIVVCHNDFMKSEWVKYMPPRHLTLKNVLFAPLNIQGKTVGIIGLANKPDDFNEDDMRVARGLGELAAVALQNSRNLEERERAEREKEKTIDDLQRALKEVKTLSGLLPICSICKEIRDDQGYWNQIEFFISERSQAQFTHSICPKCAKVHYPDINIYEE